MLVLIRGEANQSLSGLSSCYGSTGTIMGKEEKFIQGFENTNLCYLRKEIIMMTTEEKVDAMCSPPVISLVLLPLVSILAREWQCLWQALR